MKTVLNVRVDEHLKAQAKVIAAQMGLNLSSLVNLLLAKLNKDKKIEINLNSENWFDQEFENKLASYIHSDEFHHEKKEVLWVNDYLKAIKKWDENHTK